MRKKPDFNMGVKSSVRTSTIQPAVPKLSEVYFNDIFGRKFWVFWKVVLAFQNFAWAPK